MSILTSPLGKAGENPTPPASLPHRLWDLLTRPNARIHEPDQRLQARFISALLLVIVAAITVIIASILIAGTDSPTSNFVYVLIVVLGIFEYGLSRTERSELAITLFVITGTISVFILYMLDPTTATALYYMAVIVFVSGIMLSVRTTTILVAVVVGGMILLSRLTGYKAQAYSVINYATMLSLIVLVFVQFRNTLENTRRKQIIDALQEVETLNTTLSKTNSDLLRANAVAKEAARLKSEFMATMSHELRTPLNAMLGFSGILLEGMGGEFDDEARHMIVRIQQNSERLLKLINDVLDIAKIEAGRMDLVSVPMSPRKLVDGWKSQMGVLAERKHLQFITQIDDDLPEQLFGDPERLSQIAINLLSNAFKFTESGSVTLALHRDDNAWQMQVIDSGIGIPPHAINYIFDEFRQLDGSSTRAYGGTGLGLAIVRNLCRMMEGTVQVSSKLNEGSTFTVTLPLRPVITEPTTPIAEVN
ncbi:MAG TPA: ATP-binding protein [Phototrophicaceae bacterium]|nr:ATP-binding protein [Phototrophicaceae bacterium]